MQEKVRPEGQTQAGKNPVRAPEPGPQRVAGRANVTDTPELISYYAELARLETGALWTVANDIEPWFPKPKSVPVMWRYDDLRPLVIKAPELVSAEDAGRRVVMLVNPGRKELPAACGLLFSGLQIMDAGEVATSHKHMANALRFIMEGEGAYTVVDGERVTLGRNDFVLTPNGTWHEHGVDASGTRCIWQDGLDIPMVNTLDANFFTVHKDMRQTEDKGTDSSWGHYGGGFLVPADARTNWKKPYSPLLKYPWGPTYEALLRAAKTSAGSPYDGIIMDYINPLTGGPVMATMGASMQLLRAGEETKTHRHTGSFVYQCAKGQGTSIVAGQRFDWRERDIFVVPSWAAHSHANASKTEDACLFSFNDLPVMRALGLMAEQAGE
jgi:gentisate 1,2-dioxygenase